MSIEMAWICPKCGSTSPHETEAVCKDCGTPLVCTQVSADEVRSYMEVDKGAKFNQWLEEMKEKYVIGYQKKAEEKSSREDLSQYVPKCPTCGCPDISRIPSHQSSLDINNSVMAIVTNRTGKTFVCNNCGYTW